MANIPREGEPGNSNWGKRLKVTAIAASPYIVGFGIEKLTGGSFEEAVKSGLLFGTEFWAATILIFMGALVTGRLK